MTTIKDFTESLEKEVGKDRDIENCFIIPLSKLLLKLKLVERDKEKKLPVPYVSAEIVIPREIATSIGGVINSDMKLALLCVKFNKSSPTGDKK